MASFVQTDVGLYWGGYDLSSSFNAVALNLSNSPQDDTVYGDTFTSNAAGLSAVTLEAEGFWDSTTDGVLQSSLGSDDTVLSVTPVDQSAGQPSIFTKVTSSQYQPMDSGQVGNMLGFSLSAEGRGEKSVYGEIIVAPGTNRTSSETVTNTLGAVSATQSIYSALHVIKETGGSTPTLNVTVESAPSNWSGEGTRITHTEFTGIGAEMKSTAGANTNTFWRVKWVITGGGTFDFIVSLGII